tara:strand:+ start:55 stop:375 length:321 start_codon:yes stop_codon:yes gene_type:complete
MIKQKFNLIFLFLFVLFISGCADIKAGLTGQRSKNADEFLVKKKDPLVMPPRWEELPNPDDDMSIEQDSEEIFEISINTNELNTSSENIGDVSDIESSILNHIKNN